MKRLIALMALVACGPDETISAYGGDDDYVLTEMNGAPVTVRITLNISDTGQITGQGPCNSYFADQSAPYPWIAVGPIASTRKACPDLTLEGQYFAALSSMTIAEVAGPVLILTNEAEDVLIYKSP